jgi:quercetin dioxygenase-like cupin family protein
MSSLLRVHRWDEIALEKVTEMISRKVISGDRATLTQVYFKRGALVPQHSHEAEQLTYVLQGVLRYLVESDEVVVREGEVLHVPAGTIHQAEALEDTFVLGVFSPPRHGWLDSPDDESHR